MHYAIGTWAVLYDLHDLKEPIPMCDSRNLRVIAAIRTVDLKPRHGRAKLTALHGPVRLVET